MKKIIVFLSCVTIAFSAHAAKKQLVLGDLANGLSKSNAGVQASVGVDNSRGIARIQERLISRNVAEAIDLHPDCTRDFVGTWNMISQKFTQAAIATEQAAKEQEAEFNRALANAKQCTEEKSRPVVVAKPEPKPEPKSVVTTIPENVVSEIAVPVSGYAVGATSLSDAMKGELDVKVRLLQQYPDANYRLVVEGHTCDIASDNVNRNVAGKRAETVKDYLVSKGIDAGRITVDGSKGESEPVVPNTNVNNRKQNRRVVIIVR